MTFKPQLSLQRWYGLLVMLGLAGLDVLVVKQILGRPVDGLSFVLALWVFGSLLILVYLGYRTFGAFTMEYWVDRDGVTLVWGPTRQTVPMGQIERVQRGAHTVPVGWSRLWHWPCPERRRLLSSELGIVNSYATRPLPQQVILVTSGESYGVTPSDVQGFLDALQTRHALGPGRPVQATLRRPPLWTWSLWRDRGALVLVGLGLLGLLVMFGALCFRFPTLSPDLPLHFDVNGLPDRIAAKSGLFALPVIGLVAWSFNLAAGIWLYRHVQRGAAYLLWGGALAVEAIAGLALLNLMRW